MSATPLILDLETSTDGKRLLAVGALFGQGELHERKLDKLEPWLKEARVLVGHNIVRHDAPFLRKRLGDASLAGKQLADTLCWSALLYADRPYHKLVKGYKLHSEDAENNPLSDAKLCGQLLEDLLGMWNTLRPAMRALYHALLHDRAGYDGFLQLAGAMERPTADASTLVQEALAGRLCKRADLGRFAKEHPVELAHALALIATEDEASVLPPWVVKELPGSVDILHALRFTPCSEPGCAHCTEKLDPQKGLERVYGYPDFRRFDGEEGMGIQERSVRHALAGGSLLTIFPTGGGKSLTFQLPALMQGELTRALTVVVSPLVSLMKDQVEVLEDRFGNVQAVQLSSLLSPLERRNVLERIEQGGAHLLYVAPESLRSPTLFRLLCTRHIARFVVDEAHCFSAWGHDFRVDYLYIARFIRELMEAKGLSAPIPVSCFTATAKPQVIADIRDYFRNELGLELHPFISHARREPPDQVFRFPTIPPGTSSAYTDAASFHRNIAIYSAITMGVTKTDLFTAQQNQLATWAKVLGHPARIAILQYLLKQNACVCGGLVEELGLAQATISQHLRELKDAGLITGTVEGTSVCYCIEPKAWAKAEAAFTKLFAAYKSIETCC